MRFRRLFTVSTTVVALSALSAGPALAHYCYKDGWNEAAKAGASKSQPWMTAEDWSGMIGEVRDASDDQDCIAALDAFEEYVGTFSDDTLFMGPGLLAGGAIHKGKEAGQSGIGHMSFEYLGPIFATCFSDEGPPA